MYVLTSIVKSCGYSDVNKVSKHMFFLFESSVIELYDDQYFRKAIVLRIITKITKLTQTT